MTDESRTRSRPEREGAAAPAGPFLVLAMEYQRPLGGAVRLDLGGAARVTVGRGRTRHVRRDAELWEVEVADEWMSTRHLELRRDGTTWRAADLGSKNGTRIAGAAVREVELADGDAIEIGDTMFLFRAADAAAGRDPEILEADALAGLDPALVTLAPALRAELHVLLRIAAADLPIVLVGPTGSGKEVTARAIHQLSGRSGPFVAVNCAAIPPSLIESELFGVRRGAFSGADRDRTGLIAAAHGGTLFLDEFAEMPVASQAALLRALQEREVVPVGGTSPVAVDLRVVSATHRDVDERVNGGQLREDLLARLRGQVIQLPALADRLEDLGLLVAGLVQRLAPERAAALRLERGAGARLFAHRWPQNIRELEQTLRAALALADGDLITEAAVERALARSAPSRPAEPEPDGSELGALLERHAGNLSAVARALQTSVSQVRRLMARAGLDPARFRR